MPFIFKRHLADQYFSLVPRWAEISLQGMATKMSPANMDVEKDVKFYTLCYHGL